MKIIVYNKNNTWTHTTTLVKGKFLYFIQKKNNSRGDQKKGSRETMWYTNYAIKPF